jgi:hypothetical protein
MCPLTLHIFDRICTMKNGTNLFEVQTLNFQSGLLFFGRQEPFVQLVSGNIDS